MRARTLLLRRRARWRETGWRPRGIEFVMTSQPLIGNADYPQDLYLARGAELVGEPEVDETAEVAGCRLTRRPR